MMSTFYFIKKNDFSNTLKIAEILLHHPHDLIQKAVGWMLREVGDREYDVEYRFYWTVINQCQGPCCGMPLKNLIAKQRNFL